MLSVEDWERAAEIQQASYRGNVGARPEPEDGPK
jgi:hypothetical protein